MHTSPDHVSISTWGVLSFLNDAYDGSKHGTARVLNGDAEELAWGVGVCWLVVVSGKSNPIPV